ncbi:hypothetical protein JSY36_16820 [Bacillus sp. H-16]|uniref:hypothetical protein n=1 Tax=Alteribacter salitolerans TaxID=2912333 RepID=UPI001965A07F|nr:hypothetical protein [Alteribacter salitolerans]MBM7097398.1 hypothetical protein [Alteribacter salitolerans]
MSDRFEKGMKELSKGYENQPLSKPPETIYENVKKAPMNKPKKYRMAFLNVAATLLLVIGGGILGGSYLMSENNVSQEPPAVPADDLENEEPDDRVHVEENQEYASRDDTFIHEYELEGMPETFEYLLYINEQIGFSTYIEEQFEVSSNESDRVTFYSMYGAVEREDAFIQIIHHPEEDPEVIESVFRNKLASEGYTENHEADITLSQGEMKSYWVKGDSAPSEVQYQILLDHKEGWFEIRVKKPASLSEGRFTQSAKLFVDELMFR